MRVLICLCMAQVHSCGYYSGQAFIEIGRVKSLAEKQNVEATENHLALIEKEIDKVGLHCSIENLADEKQHLANIRTALNNKQFDKIDLEALQFEKKLILKLAKHHNDGGDPLEIIPSRMYESLG